MADFKLAWLGDAIMQEVTAAAKKGLLESGADLQQISSEEAPVDLGDLRGNASVDDSNLSSLQVAVGYSLPYALRQHEELDYSHPSGGKAKFLEDPARANFGKYKAFIGKKIGEAIR